jgi:hypothetical protein
MAGPFTRPSLQRSPLTPRRLANFAGLDRTQCFATLRGYGQTRKRRGEREATSRAANSQRLKRRRRIDIEIQEPQNPYVGFVFKPPTAESRVNSTYRNTKRYKQTLPHGLPRGIELDWLCLPYGRHQTRSPHNEHTHTARSLFWSIKSTASGFMGLFEFPQKCLDLSHWSWNSAVHRDVKTKNLQCCSYTRAIFSVPGWSRCLLLNATSGHRHCVFDLVQTHI